MQYKTITKISKCTNKRHNCCIWCHYGKWYKWTYYKCTVESMFTM